MGRVLRWSLVAVAAGFAAFAYAYVTLPDVRPLATSNPPTTAFIELRAAEAHAAGRVAAARSAVGQLRAHLGSSQTRGARGGRRCVLAARGRWTWIRSGSRSSTTSNAAAWLAGAARSRSSSPRTCTCRPSRNPIRKLREIIIARRLEAELSKRRILELYLNVVEWGDGIYGAESAARAYFHKPASQLGPAESALLAGALVNPRILVPARPNARLLGRQRLILGRMGSVTPPAVVPTPAARAKRQQPRLSRQSRLLSRQIRLHCPPVGPSSAERSAASLRLSSLPGRGVPITAGDTLRHSLTPVRRGAYNGCGFGSSQPVTQSRRSGRLVHDIRAR